MRFLITSLVGGAPAGGVTFGSFESGPLVGVVTVGVVAVGAPALASAWSPLFSLPMVIVLLEPLEPHAASSAPVPSVASATAARARMVWGTLKLVTAGQTSGSGGALASAVLRVRASRVVAIALGS